MSKVTCIIIEDEPLAVKILTEYIQNVPFLELKATFKNALLASDYLRDNAVDLLFLDIHLPKLKGFAFLKTLSESPAVIVTSAYHQYALEGFELNVTDYLLKPFSLERFLVAVGKVKPEFTTAEITPSSREFIFLNVQKKKVKILFSDILYIESQREYVKIVTVTKEYSTKMSTHEIESLLPINLFKRIHRSFIVSISKIESFTKEYVDVNGISIPIGRDYRGNLEKL